MSTEYSMAFILIDLVEIVIADLNVLIMCTFWVSPGTEAMFADLGHFTALSIRVSATPPFVHIIFFFTPEV